VDLVERAGHLKPMLVDFALSPRFDRELSAVVAESFPTGVVTDESKFSMVLDHFALQHRLPSGTTVVEAFAAAHPELTDAERDILARGGSSSTWRPLASMPSACSGSTKTASSSPSRRRSWKARSSREAPIPISAPRRWTISRSSSGRSVITCAVLAANTMGHGCSAQTAGSGWVRRADMAGPDLPRPREPYTSAHLQRWPMGAERTETA
jgi:hypothetical protein